jgi:odorant receptor
MQVQKSYQGLVADLLPNIKLMQASGHFLFRYVDGSVLVQKMYAYFNLAVVLFQFFMIIINMILNTGEVNELTANTITVLFFLQGVIKLLYFALNSENFYRTWGTWNQSNTHPLFAESDARYHGIALAKMRKLLMMVVATTVMSVVGN